MNKHELLTMLGILTLSLGVGITAGTGFGLVILGICLLFLAWIYAVNS